MGEMYYQLVGKSMPFSSPEYRGTYRCGPAYQEGLPEDAPVNVGWRHYVSQYGEKLRHRDEALRLAEEYANIGQSFDVVQVEVAAEGPSRDPGKGPDALP